MGVMMGIIKTCYLDSSGIANYIPVDLSCNGMLCAAWAVATSQSRQVPRPLVYNNVPSRNLVTWEVNTLNLKRAVLKYPLKGALMCPDFVTHHNLFIFWFFGIVLHLIPALIIDAVLWIKGEKPK